jgi:CSLREA domain-containing protein
MQRARACAGFAPPNDLVRVECDPDGGHERERDERRHDHGCREQQRAGDRGDQAAATERARHTQAQRYVGEQIEGGAATVGGKGFRPGCTSSLGVIASVVCGSGEGVNGLRNGTAFARFVVVFVCVAAVAGSTTRETAQASHCVITPALGDATVNQGLPYGRLVRGKETLVKLYLKLPSTLPRCAGTKPAIKVVGGTLMVKNGTAQIGPSISLLPDAVNALVTSASVLQDSPADAKFIVLGANLPPATSGIAGSFNATFSITVNYQSKGAPVQGVEDTFTSTQAVTFTTSKVVELPTKALRVLAVPMAAALDSLQTSTLATAFTNLSRMYPVQDLSGSGLPRVGVLPTANGGIRYAVNNPGFVDVGTQLFCGTSTNYAPIQTQLQAFMNAYNNANTTADDVDRTVGVIPNTKSNGSPCFEGFTVTNTQQAWIRLVPDAPGVPSTAGSLLGMEFCHTFGCTTSSATLHSYFTNADNLAENVDRAFNGLTWKWLSDDRSVMRFTAPGWDNGSTVLEKGDLGYLLCGLGGANTSGCPAAGTGTLTGVAAGTTFQLDGTTDGAGAATTTVGNSHKSTVAPTTAPDPASPYRFIQKNSTSPTWPPSSGQLLSDLGVPVRFVHSGHAEDDQDVGAAATGAFSFAFPLDPRTVRIELRKGGTLLWARNLTAAPQVTNVTVSGEPDIVLLRTAGTALEAPSQEPAPKVASRPMTQSIARLGAEGTREAFGLASVGLSSLLALDATFTVNSNADPGDGNCDESCTLRDAILAANGTAGADTIAFSLSSDELTITPTEPLPPVTESVTIDGTTQPGFEGTPIVELNGTGISSDGSFVPFENGLTLMPEADNNTIRGLVIRGFTTPGWGAGIDIRTSSNNNVIEGNFIGTNTAGTAAQGNVVGVVVGGANNMIGGNVLSGNQSRGLQIQGSSATGNSVVGNLIGTDATGAADLGNGGDALRVEGASLTTIGGTSAAERNVVSGNGGHGILLHNSTSNTVQGNYAGTNAAGTAAIANGIDGIAVDGGGNNTIGGPGVGEGNLTSGNTNQGISIFGVDFPSTTGNIVQGNKAGTNFDGTATIPNGGEGIRMHNALNTTVGGTVAGAGNLVSGNASRGVTVIASPGTATGNRILGNSIYGNGGIGIDLGVVAPLGGVTPNDDGDGDTGPNNLQNFPDLTSVTTGGAGTTVQGTLDTEANKAYRLEFFANSACDASGNGEGQTLLGSRNVKTTASGNTSFTFTSPTAIDSGAWVTATATDPSGNTSEFSACRQAGTAEPPPAPGIVDVGVDATDDFPADARATFYWDCGGVKYPIKVGVPPTSFDSDAGTAHFDLSTDTSNNCETAAGTGTISVLVDDGFTQTPFTEVANAVVEADDQTPVAAIAAPFPGAKPLQFESITLWGSGHDAEEGALTGTKLTWSSPTLFAGVRTGEKVPLTPPASGWTPGTYLIKLTATDSDGDPSAEVTTSVEILADNDHDGLSATFESQSCFPTNSDNDPSTPGNDLDLDGIPTGNELNTANGPCMAEDTYNAIIDWDPDNLQRMTSGTPITVKVRVPFRNVGQIVPSSVKITKITYVDANGDFAEAQLDQRTVSWSATGAEALAKFDRQAFIGTLNRLGIANQTIMVEVSGAFLDGTQWTGKDRTNVK